MPCNGVTCTAPSVRRRLTTSCTSTSGAEAPAVIPTRRFPATRSKPRLRRALIQSIVMTIGQTEKATLEAP